jgi:hypothetical protein
MQIVRAHAVLLIQEMVPSFQMALRVLLTLKKVILRAETIPGLQHAACVPFVLRDNRRRRVPLDKAHMSHGSSDVVRSVSRGLCRAQFA